VKRLTEEEESNGLDKNELPPFHGSHGPIALSAGRRRPSNKQRHPKRKLHAQHSISVKVLYISSLGMTILRSCCPVSRYPIHPLSRLIKLLVNKLNQPINMQFQHPLHHFNRLHTIIPHINQALTGVTVVARDLLA